VSSILLAIWRTHTICATMSGMFLPEGIPVLPLATPIELRFYKAESE
jgi:hypothetical protein